MAVGTNADADYLRRSSIPSGGTGTLSGGGFSDFFVGVWLYRPSSGNSYANTADGHILHFAAGAREVKLGFDNTFGSGTASDPLLQVIFNSGGGTGATQTFASANFFDEWVYYFFYENSANSQVAGYIKLSDLNTATTITRANDNAGSQYVNTLTIGSDDSGSFGVMGHYAYARARDSSSITASDILTWAASDSTISGDWGFWPLVDNADTGDDSGNSRTLTFGGTLTTETSPTLSTGVSGTVAKTLLNDTLAALGTTTIVGSLTETMANDTSSAAGTTTVVGSLAVTLANDTGAISGSVGSPVSGTLAVTLQNDTVSASGTTTIVGSLAETMTNDTSSASGTTTIVGALAETLANDTLAASGSVGSAVGGSLNVTLQNDTLAAQGSSTVLASLLYTLLNDTSAISGTTTVVGSLAETMNNDTLAASGTSGTPPASAATRLPLTGVGA